MANKTPPNDFERQAVAAANGTMPAANPGDAAGTPMTEAQAAELRELARQAGEPFDGNLDFHQAEDRIAYLRTKV